MALTILDFVDQHSTLTLLLSIGAFALAFLFVGLDAIQGEANGHLYEDDDIEEYFDVETGTWISK